MAIEICTAPALAPRAGGVTGYLQLLRLPNLVTAAADILAGYAAAGLPVSPAMAPLVGGSIALYAGGVVLNDFFDRRLDAVERPERPIPSGRVRPAHAVIVGLSLLGAGIFAAFLCSAASGIIAAAIAGCALSYDAWAKRHAVIGPMIMGLCRGGNLLLGLSATPAMLGERWFLALLPFAYIAGITAMSAGEVHGGSRLAVLTATLLFGAVCGAIVLLGLNPSFQLMWAVPVVLLLGYRVLPAMGRACREPSAAYVRMAVKSGVLSLIVLDAAIATGYAGPWYGAAVLALLGLASALARMFAVT
jgi:4-hydroxybenzoate polyprenyltransferase